ncbi:DUF3828 domain-containing protein [Salmonella enterica]|nr:DUF3828 domain-containing protein [Salmonella enterica]
MARESQPARTGLTLYPILKDGVTLCLKSIRIFAMNHSKKIYTLLTTVLLLVNFTVHSATDHNGSPVQVAKEFYSVYMDYYFRMVPPDATIFNSTMNKYVTPRFNKEIKESRICEGGHDPVCNIDGVEPGLGYVYIIRAQDAYDDWKEIKAEIIKSGKERSSVKVYLGRRETQQIIIVSMIKNNGQWQIDNVSDFRPAPYRFQ